MKQAAYIPTRILTMSESQQEEFNLHCSIDKLGDTI